MKFAVHTWNYDGTGGYPYWGEDETKARHTALSLVGDLTREGWHVSKHRLDGTKTWLTKRIDGKLCRIRIEIQRHDAPEGQA